MVARTEHRTRTGCPIACALDIVGDHWTLLIIRNLMLTEAHEYKDMLKAEEQISSSILTTRLKNLEEGGLIASIPHPESRRRKLYYLTPMGKDLVYVMVDLVLWSNKHLSSWLKIPKKKKAILGKNPDAFIQMTLDHLYAWEKENL